MVSVSETCTLSTNNMSVSLKRTDDVMKKSLSASLDRRKTNAEPHSDFSGVGRTIVEELPPVNNLLIRQPSFIHKNFHYVSTDKTNPIKSYDTLNETPSTTVEKASTPATIKNLYFKRTLGIRQSWNHLWRLNKNKVKNDKSLITSNHNNNCAEEMLCKKNTEINDLSELIERTQSDDGNASNKEKFLANNYGPLNNTNLELKMIKNHRRVQSFTGYDNWNKKR
jgi:hypothetical protein